MYHSTRPPNNSILRPLKSVIVLDTLLQLFSLSGATAACLLWFYLVLAWKPTGPKVRPVFRSLPSLFMNHNRMHDWISSNLSPYMGSAATYRTCTVALPFLARRLGLHTVMCHLKERRAHPPGQRGRRPSMTYSAEASSTVIATRGWCSGRLRPWSSQPGP